MEGRERKREREKGEKDEGERRKVEEGSTCAQLYIVWFLTVRCSNVQWFKVRERGREENEEREVREKGERERRGR